MKHALGILLLIGIVLNSGCKKSPESPINFSAITVTDTTCLYISDVDITDWGSDAGWATIEYNLISFKDSVRISDSLTGYVQVSAICANPNDGHFSWQINTERECMMRMALVNNEMQLLHYEVKRMPGGPLTLNYDFRNNTSFHKNENYRIYYGFYNKKDSLYYKGHGDLRLE